MSTDPTVDQMDAEIADRASTGYTQSFRNGSHQTDVTPLSELQDVLDRRERRARAVAGGVARLAQFDPNI